MTDISSFLANGGKIKKGKTVRAVGCDIYYSLPGGIPAVKSEPARPCRHMGVKGDGRYWEGKK